MGTKNELVFVMACLRDNLGSNTAFHAIDGLGYTTDLDKAHKFTKEEAQRYWDSAREFDLPLDFAKIEAYAVYKVDMQYIPNKTTTDNSKRYVAFKRFKYDGNDVFWLTRDNGLSTNFIDAKLLSEPWFSDDYVSIPYVLADVKKRRTFAHQKISKRSMIQASGLVAPKRISRRRKKELIDE